MVLPSSCPGPEGIALAASGASEIAGLVLAASWQAGLVMIGLRRFGASNIEGFDQSIQQIIIVKAIGFIDLLRRRRVSPARDRARRPDRGSTFPSAACL